MSKSVQTTLLYEDATTRNYTFDAAEPIVPNDVRSAVQAINASIAGGTDDGLHTTFTADDGANLTKISGAKLTQETVTMIFGGEF